MFQLDLSDLEGELKEETRAVVKEIAIDLSNELKKEAPVDTGRLTVYPGFTGITK